MLVVVGTIVIVTEVGVTGKELNEVKRSILGSCAKFKSNSRKKCEDVWVECFVVEYLNEQSQFLMNFSPFHDMVVEVCPVLYFFKAMVSRLC